jgi:hypothetical protein
MYLIQQSCGAGTRSKSTRPAARTRQQRTGRAQTLGCGHRRQFKVPVALERLSIGVNWYLNRNYELSLNYDATEFDRGVARVPTAPMNEHCWCALHQVSGDPGNQCQQRRIH